MNSYPTRPSAGRFDRGEIDADGNERAAFRYNRAGAGAYGSASGGGAQGFPGGFGGRTAGGASPEFVDFGDLFANFTGQQRQPRGPTKGEDQRYRLSVDFMEAVAGPSKRVGLSDGRTIDIQVPAGTEEGQTLRLRGQGNEGTGGAAKGDVLVEIGVRPHPFFRRDGNDIQLELPITIQEAILGGKVDVPTIAGSVRLTIPEGASSGRVLRLKGKGVAGRGDQLVTLKIVMPEKIDEQLKTAVRAWSEAHPYDPRGNLHS